MVSVLDGSYYAERFSAKNIPAQNAGDHDVALILHPRNSARNAGRSGRNCARMGHFLNAIVHAAIYNAYIHNRLLKL